MEVDNDDIELIRTIHNQYYKTKDEKNRNGILYVLKDILGRYLLQIKHYEPWVSDKAKDEMADVLPDIPVSRIKLHDCNVENPVPLTKKQKKFFVNGNSHKKLFHLEHDPPTIQMAKTILKENITDDEIKNELEHYRLCFITVEEDKALDRKGFHSQRPPDAYKQCEPPIIVHKVSE